MYGIRENLYGIMQEKLKIPDSFSLENRKYHACPHTLASKGISMSAHSHSASTQIIGIAQ